MILNVAKLIFPQIFTPLYPELFTLHPPFSRSVFFSKAFPCSSVGAMSIPSPTSRPSYRRTLWRSSSTRTCAGLAPAGS